MRVATTTPVATFLPQLTLAAGLVLSAVSQAQAQSVTVEASPAQRCLTLPTGARETPVYPVAMRVAGRGASLTVQLSFVDPAAEPRVELLEQDAEAEDLPTLLQSIEEVVRRLRLPCMAPGDGTVRLQRTYVFKIGEEAVFLSKSQDPDQERARELWKCAARTSGWQLPPYPEGARRDGTEGRVLALLRFSSPTKPPEAQLFYRSTALSLVSPLRTWMRDYRLPCYSGDPFTMRITFVYHLEGNARYGFNRPVTLPELQAMAHAPDTQSRQLDTHGMACPFELQLAYSQPHLPNRVWEVGDHNLARDPLLQRLANLKLKLRTKELDAVYGDIVTVTVPCTKITL